MSGIFAASVSSDSAGIRSELKLLSQRASARGKDAIKIASFRDDGTIGYVGATGHVQVGVDRALTDARHYTLVGCAYGAPSGAQIETIFDVPPFTSKDSQWLVTIDGIVTGYTGQQVADIISREGWSTVETLHGQFAIIGVERSSDGIYWACKAKPLYGLHHPYDGITMVASQRDDLYGFYHETRTSSPFALEPYTRGRISREGTFGSHPLNRKSSNGSLVLSGGGLDTAVAAWDNAATYSEEPTVLLHIDYGQKARVAEWHATQELSVRMRKHLGVTTSAIRLKFNLGLLAGDSSPLTGDKDVESNPQAGQAHEWFPARNTVLMSMGLSWAEANGMARIVTGINMEAAGAYPDNEQEWLIRWQSLVPYAVGDSVSIDLEAPLVGMSKKDIVKLGDKLGFPFETFSWSCYNGGVIHCGTCSSCRCRRAAFVSAGVTDPTEYKD